MLKSIQIENFKSVQNLQLDLGHVNLLIGENGCGKSNILEAITLAAAAESNKLDNEFLTSRGVRVTSPNLMRSAFEEESQKEPIRIRVRYQDFENIEKLSEEISQYFSSVQEYILEHDNGGYSKWKSKINFERLKLNREIYIEGLKRQQEELKSQWKVLHSDAEASIVKESILKKIEALKYECSLASNLLEHHQKIAIQKFLIFSPENAALRNFHKEGQIEPLGTNGEGLLKLLQFLEETEQENKLGNIFDSLKLFDWFQALEIPRKLSEFENAVKITDKFLYKWFDQRSANEGFLFALFYLALIVSEETPSVFAIDNIDTSLDLKLCSKLIPELISLAKKHNKQIFLTSRNLSIINGFDLEDEEQRLFAISRNKNGHTCAKEITEKISEES